MYELSIFSANKEQLSYAKHVYVYLSFTQQQQQQQQQPQQQQPAPQAVAAVPVPVPVQVPVAAAAVSKCNDLKLEYPPNTSATSLVKLSLDEVTQENLTFIRVLDCDSSEVSMFKLLNHCIMDV